LGSYISVRNRRALSAHNGPDLAALWPGVEVVTGALEGDSLHIALNANLHIRIQMYYCGKSIKNMKYKAGNYEHLIDADLSVKGFPVEDKTCMGIAFLRTKT